MSHAYIPTSEEVFLTAPANLTSLWGDPWGPVSYGAPIPVNAGFRGLGDILSGSIASSMGAAQGFLYGGPVGAVIGAAAGIPSLFQTSVGGMQKQDATTLVNGLEVILKQNLASFKANPTPANQQAALAAFSSIWQQLVSGCSSYAGAGTACVNDRSPGGKWDWWSYYYTPIADYSFPQAVASSNVSGGATPSATTVAGGSPAAGVSLDVPIVAGVDNSTLLLLGGAALVAFMMMRN